MSGVPRRVAGWALGLALLAVGTRSQAADIGHVVVLSWDGTPYNTSTDAARQAAAREFYRTHSDSYDFLVVFPAFETQFTEEAGLHVPARNEVQGIGSDLFDRGAEFGSAARLRSYIDVRALDPGAPLDVDSALSVVAHEIAHAWSGRVRFRDPASGSSSIALLGREDAHWSFFLDSDGSVLYGSKWKDNGNGTFSAVESRTRYSALDLYLMGFASQAEVPPLRLLEPTSATTFTARDFPPPSGTTISARVRTIQVSNIISAEGPRIPDVSNAPKGLRAAFILLVPPGQQASADQLAFVDAVRRAWANHFFFLTHGRAVMETDLVEVPPGPIASNPTVSAGLEYLLSRQGANGDWQDQPETRIRDTQSALEALALFGTDSRVPGALAAGGAALGQSSVDGVDAASRRALGLLAARLPVGLVREILETHVDPVLNQDHGYGYSLGYRSNVLDSALAGLALLAGGESTEALNPLAEFLLGQRNPDGGWPYAAGGPSRIEPTARVVELLAKLPRSAERSSAAAAGLAFLRAHRRSDGLFADDVASPSATALAIQALASWRELSSTEAQGAAAALLSLQRPDGSWGGSAFQTAQALKALRTLLSPNLALAASDVSLSATRAIDGEAVTATVVVRNTGFADAASVRIRAYDSAGAPLGESKAISVQAGAAASVSFSLDTTAHGGSTEVFLVVDPDGVVDELREDDNRVVMPLVIDAPPAGIDLFVRAGSVVSTPAQIDRIPAPLSVTAVLGNVGLTAAGPVDVSLVLQGSVVATTRVELAGRSDATVALSGIVSAVTGEIVAEVRVDPSGLVAEEREDNNTASLVIPVVPRVDVAVGSLALSPGPVEQGQELAIAFELSNRGTKDIGDGRVRTSLKSLSGAKVVDIEDASFSLAAGQSAPRQLTWRASAAGEFVVEVVASSAGDADAANNAATAAIRVNTSSLPNLVVSADSVKFSPDPPPQGKQTSVTVTVSNSGGATTGPFSVAIYLGNPAEGGTLLGTSTFSELAPGSSVDASAVFTPALDTTAQIVARVDPQGQVSEFDEEDNLVIRPFTPASLPDLVVSEGDILLDEPFPREGMAVGVAVSVFNEGGQASTEAPVELYLGVPEQGGTLIAVEQLGAVEGRARREVRFSWSTTGLTGAQQLVAVVNGNRSAFERSYDNNRTTREVLVQDGALALSNPYFSPNHDGVKDQTDILFRLQEPARVQVQIRDPRGREIRSLETTASSGGALTWDGRDASGRMARDGIYELSVRNRDNETVLGTLTAVVDTNRSPLQDAIGTNLITTEPLGAGLDARRAVPMPEDVGVAFIGYPQDLSGCGLYFQPLGGDPVRLSPAALSPELCNADPETLSVSPDGTQFAYFTYEPCGSTWCEAIHLFSSLEQVARTVVREDFDVSRVFLSGAIPRFTPDGREIVFKALDLDRWEDRIEIIEVSGANRRQLAIAPGLEVIEYLVSTDGSSISYLTDRGGLFAVARGGGAARQLVAPDPDLRLDEGPDRHHAWFSERSALLLARGAKIVGGWDESGPVEWVGGEVVEVDPSTGGTRTVLIHPRSALALSPLDDALVLPAWDRVSDEAVFVSAPIGNPVVPLFAPPELTEVEGLEWSHRGSFLLGEFGGLGDPFSRAIVSLANLTNRYVASRPAGSSAVAFRGTAADLNFDRYELAVAPYPEGSGLPAVIDRSAVPVIDGVLGEWAPPAPGLYETAVTVTDRAGNALTRKTQVAWSNSTAIANVAVNPEFLSPNADAVQDAARVTYTATAPVTTEFAFHDPSGVKVRSIGRTHLNPEDGTLSWDGTDDRGARVPDGVYRMKVEGSSHDLVVDTTAPSVELVLSHDLPGGGDTEFRFEEVMGEVIGGLAGGAPERPVQIVMIETSWRAQDRNFFRWMLESSAAESPTAFATVREGTSQNVQHTARPVWQATGVHWRLRATDLAGNEAVSPSRVAAERLFVTAVGDAAPVVDSSSSLVLAGRAFPRIDRLEQRFDTQGNERAFLFGQKRFAIALNHSISKRLVSFSVAYGTPGGQVVDSQNVTAVHGDAVVLWDASGVSLSSPEVEIRATDELGRVFSDAIKFTIASQAQVCVATGTGQVVSPELLSGVDAETARLEFIRSTDGVVEQTLGAQDPIDFSALSTCQYELRLTGTSVDGRPVSRATRVDVCGIRVVQADVVGAEPRVKLDETFPQPILSVEVFARARGTDGAWSPVGTFPGFEGASGPLRLNLGGEASCSVQELRLVARLADGTAFDSSTTGVVAPCTAVVLEVPCTDLLFSVSHDGPAPFCTGHAATYQVGIVATSGLASLEAFIQPLSGTPVTPLVVTGFSPGGRSGTVSIDTSQLGEGRYLVGARAVDAVGVELTRLMDPGSAIVVDRTPPQVALTFPTEGANVCPVASAGVDGRQRFEVQVAGRISDAFLEAYTLLLRDPLGGAMAPVVAQSYPTAAARSIDGIIGAFEVSAMRSGEYELVLDARDVSGGSACSAPVLFRLETGARIAALGATPALFSPDGDGALDTTAVTYSLDGQAEVTASVRSGTEDLGVAFEGSSPAGTHTVSWGGSISGAPGLSDGDYVLRLDAIDTCGNRSAADLPVTIDKTAPLVRIDAPAAGAVLGATLTVRGEASDRHFDQYELALGEGSAPVTFNPLATVANAASGVLGAFSLEGLSPGEYTVRLTGKDRVGHSAVTQVTFVVPQRDLVDGVRVSPALVSPNDDGEQDSAFVTVNVLKACTLSIELRDLAGNPVAVLSPATEVAAGVVQVAIDGAALRGRADGEYAVRVSAAAGSTTQLVDGPLEVDTTPPQLAISAPAASELVAGKVEVQGSIQDTHLTSWSLEHLDPSGGRATLRTGAGEASGLLATLRELADGAHQLVLRARDGAGNGTELVRAFRLDATPPVLAFQAPRGGDHVSGRRGPIEVIAELAEPNFSEIKLEIASSAGAPRRTLLSSSAVPPGGALGTWDVASEPDGEAVLFLTAVDQAGNTSERQITVVVDNTAPAASIDTPIAGYVHAPVDFTGTASDPNLAGWTLALADGPPGAASRFVAFASGTTPVESGVLGALAALPSDGTYTARLTVTDRAGNQTEGTVELLIDTAAPAPPTGLTAQVIRPSDVTLSWAPTSSADVVGYLVLRAQGDVPLRPITTSPVAGTTFSDAQVPDGSHRYAVVAVDGAGNQSDPSGEVRVSIDATPPAAVLLAPAPGERVGGAYEIVGTAFSASDFREYRLSIGAGVAPSEFTLLRRSGAGVQNGVLGGIDTRSLAQGATYTLALEAEDLSGNVGAARVTFEVDNVAPTAPVLHSATANGSTVTVEWDPSPDSDLLGYLVYRDGAIANAPPGKSFSDFTPFLLPAGTTTYADQNVPDGDFTYQVQAVDLGRNLSALSNAIRVMVETGSPSAEIRAPVALERLEGPVTVAIEVTDLDVASVQLEARAAGQPAFNPIGDPRTVYPYVVTFDPATVGSDVIELRAVATDVNGRTDSAPKSVVVFHDPPLTPPTVSTKVTGREVAIGWSDANAPDRIAGYNVLRAGTSILPTPPRATGTATASSTASGAPGNAIDGNSSTLWRSRTGLPQTWEVALAAPVLLQEVRGQMLSNSEVEVSIQVGGAWVVVAPRARVVSSNLEVPFPAPIAVEGVRIRFLSSFQGYGQISELTLQPLPLADISPWVDASAAVGDNPYEVKAISAFGGTAIGSAVATVYAPVLDPVAPAVPDSPIQVSGRGVAPGALVSLFVDGLEMAQASADGEGVFAASVPLHLGSNRISAQGADANGNRSLRSPEVVIDLDPRPTASVELALLGVTGSDVTLAFNVLGDTTRIATFEVRRSGTAIASLGAQERSFVDRGLTNGTYTYSVTPLNAHGFAGQASNEVSASVVVAPPDAPSGLVVSAVPEGGALDVAWTAPPTGAAGFRLERALSAGGSFQDASGTITATSFVDRGLQNGVTYFYRVLALDELGNASAPSGIASGTPADTVAPDAPRITQPTTAAKPVTFGQAAVMIAGLAEQSAEVELFQNGRSVGKARALTRASALEPIPTAYPAFSFQVTADGRYAAYVYFTPSFTQAIAVEDLGSHTVRSITPTGVSLRGLPVPSPDGRKFAIEAFTFTDRTTRIFIGDVAAGTFTRIPSTVKREERSPSWSPDSNRLVYLTSSTPSSSASVATFDLGTRKEVQRALGGNASFPTWLPSGTEFLAFVTRVDGHELVRVNAGTFAQTPLFKTRTLAGPPAVAPDGSSIALSAYDGTRQDIYVIPTSGGAARRLTSDPRFETSPTFASDGKRLAYLSDGWVYVADLGTGSAEEMGPLGFGTIRYLPDGQLLFGANTVSFGYRFEISGLSLTPGDNFFYAVATDASGHKSGPSDVVQIVFDVSQLPDLEVAAAVQPAIPLVGEPASALVTVTNKGAIHAPGAQLAISVLGTDGSIRPAPMQSVASLAPGQSVVLAVPLDLQGLVGTQVLRAVVDPSWQIEDADRQNNEIGVRFTVANSAGLALGLSVTPGSVEADSVALAVVDLANPGPDTEVAVRVRVTTRDGTNVFAAGADEPVALGSGATAQVMREIAVGGTLAGEYVVVAEAISAGTVVASASAPLTIIPDRAVGVSVAPSRSAYLTGEVVSLEGRVENRSRNSLLSGATYRVDLLDATGAPVFNASTSLPVLPMGTGRTENTVVSASLAPGVYQVVASVVMEQETLATASSQLEVIGRPILLGAIAVAGSGNPPVIRAGQPTPISYSIANTGTAATAPGVARIVVLDGATAAVVWSTSGAVAALNPGESVTGFEQVPANALAIGTYSVALTFEESGGSSRVLATSRFRIADSAPPALAVLNLTEGMFVRDAVAPQVLARDDASGTARVAVSVDGSAARALGLASGTAVDGVWTGTLPLTPGAHTLVFSAVDLEGNDGSLSPSAANPVTLHLVSDPKAPELSVTGVTDGALYASAVVPVVTASDEHLASLVLTLDGAPFSSGASVETDGEHVLTATASDKAGNEASATVRFAIDRTPPRIAISGVVNGQYSAVDVVPGVSVSDVRLVRSSVLLNGVPFSSGQVVSTEGDYRLEVEAEDAAGNTARESISFTIDRTPPVVTIGGFSSGSIIGASVAPTYAATDAHLLEVEARLDGVPFVSGDVVTAEGDHVLTVLATDRAGNQAHATGSFTIDTTPPAIRIEGVVDGSEGEGPFTPTISVSDVHLVSSAITLNGAPFVSGTQVEEDGTYVLRVVAEDAAGNRSEQQVTFTILNVKYLVEKRLLGTFSRMLVYAHSGVCALPPTERARIEAFVTESVGGADRLIRFVPDEGELLSALRSGLYNVALLVSLDAPDRICDASGNGSPPQVRNAISRELTELVFSGHAGVLVIRTRPEDVPSLREVLGFSPNGTSAGGSVQLGGVLSGAPTLTTQGQVIGLKLETASTVGTFANGDIAAAHQAFGRGQVMGLAFDLTAAQPRAAAGDVLRKAVGVVTPGPAVLAPMSVTGVEVVVTNLARRVDTRITERLSSPLNVLGAVPEATVSPDGRTLEWLVPLEQEESVAFRYFVRLPDAVGSYATSTEVVALRASGPKLFGTFPLDLTVSEDGGALLADAQALAAQLPSSGGSSRRIQDRLAAVAARAVTSRVDVEANLADLLEAVEEARKLGSAGEAMRFALDDLIRYWEARWFVL